MTKREAVLKEWKICQAKVSQLKAKSIDNYAIVTRRTILGLNNQFSNSPLTLCDFMVMDGEVKDKKKKRKRSKNVVEIYTQLLKVAILEEIADDSLKNYEGEIDYGSGSLPDVPTIEKID